MQTKEFEIYAQDDKGRSFHGSLYGESVIDIQERLQRLGYFIINIKEKKLIFDWKKLTSKLPTTDDIVVFSRLFATVIKAGLPLLPSLTALEEETQNLILKKTIREIKADVESGLSLSTALSKHPKIFSSFFVNMVMSGEVGGAIDKVLENLAIHLEKEQDLKRKVKSAFTYPKIVLFIASAVIAVLMVYVIPIFKEAFAKLNLKLPLITVLLIKISLFVKTYWWIFVGIYLFYILVPKLLLKSKKLKFIFDWIILNVPIFGTVNKKVIICNFVRTLASMLESGVPLVQALRAADGVANNTYISNEVKRIYKSIESGGTIADAMRIGKLFPPVVIYMVSAGEASGTLSELLNKCALGLDAEIEYSLKRILVTLEPLLTLILALIVTFIALSIYLPMFDLFTSAKA